MSNGHYFRMSDVTYSGTDSLR